MGRAVFFRYTVKCMTFADTERKKLAQLFAEVGPDAPTLCEGWAARDLAAHLYVRENDPLSAAGMMVGPLEGRLDNAMEKQKSRDYAELVRDWSAGPAKLNPMRLMDPLVNGIEHFVHHEDLRRGDGVARPREFDAETTEMLLGRLKQMAPMLLRGSDKPVILTPTGGVPIVVGDKRGVAERGDDVVRVSGAPGELLLWAFGRDVVEVTIEGDERSVNR